MHSIKYSLMYCKNQCVQIPVESSYYGNQKNKQKCLINYLAASMYPGGTLDFKWQGWLNGGKNQNPKKSQDQNLTLQKPHAELMSHKNLVAELCVRDMWELSQNLQIVLNTPKNPFLNQAT